jgi:hypothetical protein
MIAHVRAGCSECGRVRCRTAPEPFQHLLLDEVRGDLLEELGVEPLRQATHLDPVYPLDGQEAAAVQRNPARLVQVFRDGRRAGHREIIVAEDGRGA